MRLAPARTFFQEGSGLLQILRVPYGMMPQRELAGYFFVAQDDDA
jgi:hypothetical protein